MIEKYYYLVMTQQDLLRNQVIEEIIRERVNYYINRKDSLDFWIVMSPLFLSSSKIINKISKTNFYRQKKQEIEFENRLYLGTIISTDFNYLCWLKLRLGYFENIKDDEELKFSFRSDGIYGFYENSEVNNLSPFDSQINKIHPLILLEKYKTSLKAYSKLIIKN